MSDENGKGGIGKSTSSQNIQAGISTGFKIQLIA